PARSRRGWARLTWWVLAIAGATALGFLQSLQMRKELPGEVLAAYRVWNIIGWLLYVPVVAVAAGPVRRLVSARARPGVLLAALLGGFLAVLLYAGAAQAVLSRVA